MRRRGQPASLKTRLVGLETRFVGALNNLVSSRTGVRRKGMKTANELLRELVPIPNVTPRQITGLVHRACEKSSGEAPLFGIFEGAFDKECCHQKKLKNRNMEFFSCLRDSLVLCTETPGVFPDSSIRHVYKFLWRTVFSERDGEGEDNFLFEGNYHEQYSQVMRSLLENDRTLELLPARWIRVFVRRFIMILLERCCNKPTNFSSLLLLMFQRFPRIGLAGYGDGRKIHREIFGQFQKFLCDFGKFSTVVQTQVLEALNRFVESVGVNYIQEFRQLASSARLFKRWWSSDVALQLQILRHMQLLSCFRLDEFEIPGTSPAFHFLLNNTTDTHEDDFPNIREMFDHLKSLLFVGTIERRVSFTNEFNDVASDILFYMQIRRRRRPQDGTTQRPKKRRRVIIPRDQILEVLSAKIDAACWVVVQNILKVLLWCCAKWKDGNYRFGGTSRDPPRIVGLITRLMVLDDSARLQSAGTPSGDFGDSLMSQWAGRRDTPLIGGGRQGRVFSEAGLKHCQMLAIQLLRQLLLQAGRKSCISNVWINETIRGILSRLVDSLGTDLSSSACDLLTLVIEWELLPPSALPVEQILSDKFFRLRPTMTYLRLANICLLKQSEMIRPPVREKLVRWLLVVEPGECQIPDRFLLLRNLLCQSATAPFPLRTDFEQILDRANPYLRLRSVLTPFAEVVPDLVPWNKKPEIPSQSDVDLIVDVEAISLFSKWLHRDIGDTRALELSDACTETAFYLRAHVTVAEFRESFEDAIRQRALLLMQESCGRLFEVLEKGNVSSKQLLASIPILRTFVFSPEFPVDCGIKLRDVMLSYLKSLPEVVSRRDSLTMSVCDDDDDFMDDVPRQIDPEDTPRLRDAILRMLSSLPGSVAILVGLIDAMKSEPKKNWETDDRLFQLLELLSSTSGVGLQEALKLLPEVTEQDYLCSEKRRLSLLRLIYNGFTLIRAQSSSNHMDSYSRLCRLVGILATLETRSLAMKYASVPVRTLFVQSLALMVSIDVSNWMLNDEEEVEGEDHSMKLLEFCVDSDFYVRLQASQLGRVCLALVEFPKLCFKDLFEDAQSEIAFVPTNGSDLQPRTSLVYLSHMTASRPSLLARGLLKLTLEFARPNASEDLIESGLDFIRSRYGYDSITSMMVEFLPTLFYLWCSPVVQFEKTWTLFRSESDGLAVDFFKRMKGVLLPIVLNSPSRLADLSALCDEDLSKAELSDRDFARVYAYSLLLSISQSKPFHPKLAADRRVARYRDEIVSCMLSYWNPRVIEDEPEDEGESESGRNLEENPSADGPFFPDSVFWSGIRALGAHFGCSQGEEDALIEERVVFRSDFSVMNLLITNLLSAERAVVFKTQKYLTLARMVHRFRHLICQSLPVLRSTLHLLSVVVQIPSLLPSSLSILKYFVQACATSQDAELDEELLRYFRLLAAHLVEIGLDVSGSLKDVLCDVIRLFLCEPIFESMTGFLYRQTRLFELLPEERNEIGTLQLLLDEAESLLEEADARRLEFVATLLDDDALRTQWLGPDDASLTSKFHARLLHFSSGPFSPEIRIGAKKCVIALGLSVLQIRPEDAKISQEFEFETYSNLFREESVLNPADLISLIVESSLIPKINSLLALENVETAAVAFSVLQSILSNNRRCARTSPLSVYLDPFRNGQRPPIRKSSPAETLEDLWSLSDHDDWVCRVTYSLLYSWVKSPEIRLCAPLVLCRRDFAESVFQIALFDIVFNSPNKARRKNMRSLRSLCERVLRRESRPDPRTVRLLLSSILLVHKMHRTLLLKAKNRSRGDDHLSFFDPMMAARAAINVGVQYTAFFFLEMAWRNREGFDGDSHNRDQGIQFDEDGEEFPKLLLQIYEKLRHHEPDGIYAVNKFYGLHSKLLRYEHEHDWVSATGMYEHALSTSSEFSSKITIGHLDALKRLHHSFSLDCALRAIPREQLECDVGLQDIFYECAWRRFPRFEIELPSSSLSGFHESLYRCLMHFALSQKERFHALLRGAFSRFILNVSSRVYDEVIRVQMLKDLQVGWGLLEGGAGDSVMEVDSDSVVSSFSAIPLRLEDLVPLESYESLLLLRLQILALLGRTRERAIEMCRLAGRCRGESRLSLAQNYIHSVSLSPELREGPIPPVWLLEEAKIAWTEGRKDAALDLLRFCKAIVLQKLGSRMNSKLMRDLLGRTCCYLARWEGETNLQVSQVIKLNFQAAKDNMADSSHAAYHFARWFDSQLEADERRVHDETRIQIYRANKLARDRYYAWLKANPRRRQQPLSPQRKRIQQNYSRMDLVVRKELEAQRADKEKLQQSRSRAFRLHLETLKYDTRHDLYSAFRVCSLWFGNSQDRKLLEILKTLCVARQQVDSKKFLPLVYQIASRLGQSDLVSDLLVKICISYPFHSLLSVFALKNGDVFASGEYKIPADQNKIDLAKKIIQRVRNKGRDHQKIVDQLRKLIEAYLEVIFWELTAAQKKQPTVTIPRTMRLIRSVDTSAIPVLTREMAPDCREFPIISKFLPRVSLLGGLHLPKVVTCVDSENTRYRQLLKGEDDMRQDAVMQQIFSLVDRLLRSTKDTRSRRLRVRRYKVIPLAPTSGLLGWVESTIPLFQYLAGRTGAHLRYHPDDPTPEEVRNKWRKLEKAKATKAVKLKEFLDLQIRPALHHFFLENGYDPSEWFSNQLRYSRSVAANSMVGFVVGLGDRHSNNILLDTNSFEVVHIDLGIAFDQGKILAIPETVPFRLTADLVDGFGVAGVEGVFRRCSIATLKVLRGNAHLLTTVLEVFLFDPLYRWDLSADKICQMQTDEDDEDDDVVMEGPTNGALDSRGSMSEVVQENRNAKRCLMIVAEKLRGLDHSEQLSVPGQVNRLIQQSTDPANLSQMYSGWAAWL